MNGATPGLTVRPISEAFTTADIHEGGIAGVADRMGMRKQQYGSYMTTRNISLVSARYEEHFVEASV
jgi:hypothetical protein